MPKKPKLDTRKATYFTKEEADELDKYAEKFFDSNVSKALRRAALNSIRVTNKK